jgi:hypothetical protein
MYRRNFVWKARKWQRNNHQKITSMCNLASKAETSPKKCPRFHDSTKKLIQKPVSAVLNCWSRLPRATRSWRSPGRFVAVLARSPTSFHPLSSFWPSVCWKCTWNPRPAREKGYKTRNLPVGHWRSCNLDLLLATSWYLNAQWLFEVPGRKVESTLRVSDLVPSKLYLKRSLTAAKRVRKPVILQKLQDFRSFALFFGGVCSIFKYSRHIGPAIRSCFFRLSKVAPSGLQIMVCYGSAALRRPYHGPRGAVEP